MRKIAVALLAGLALVLSACSSSGSSGNADSGTITLGFWDDTFRSGYQQIVSEFEKSHPGIKIDLQFTPATQYWTKIEAEAQSGQMPDLFWMNEPNFQLFQSNGELASLGSMMSKDAFDTSAFPANLLKSYTVDGQQYGLPWTAVTIGLWYNKKLFDAAHVAYPTADWTWADVQSAAAKLTDKAGGTYGIAAPIDNQDNYYNTILQAGGYIVKAGSKTSGWNTPEAISGLKFWTDLIASGSSPTLKQMTDTAPTSMFESGKLAMYYGGTWNAGTFAKTPAIASDIDVAALPKGKVQATTVEGAAYVMSAKTKHSSAAWQFMQYLVSKDAQVTQANTGVVVPARSDSVQAWVKSLPQYHLQSFVDELPYAQPYPSSQNTAAWQNQEATVFAPAWSQSQSVESVAQAMAKLTDDSLAKEHS